MSKQEVMTAKEDFENQLNEARQMTVKEIKSTLKLRDAFRTAVVRALEQALKEKQERFSKRDEEPLNDHCERLNG